MAGPWEKYASPVAAQVPGPWQKYATPEAAPPEPTPEEMAPPADDGGFTWGGLLSSLGDGSREGIAMALGAPVDLVNNLPRVANLLPGEQGYTTFSDAPVGGSRMIDTLLRGGGLIEDYEPRNVAERFANRTGQEIGATVIPLAGAGAGLVGKTAGQINRAVAAPKSVGQGLAAQFMQPLAVNPAGAVGREAAYAVASGMGAQAANETFGEGPVADTAGSIAGAGGLALASGLGQALWNLGAGAVGSPKFRGGVVDEAVADRIMNSSERLATAHAAAPNRPVDTQPLVDALRRPATVEDAVPGYRANIADRADDAGLATLAYNVDGNSPGAANVRRNANDMAVGDRMAGLAPDGVPARARADLQSGVDRQIAEALGAQEAAQRQFDDAAQAVAPALPTAEARGSQIRSGVADAHGAARSEVDQLYEALRAMDSTVDPAPLVAAAKQTDVNLAPNDAKRFRPAEAGTIADMLPGDTAPYRDTGIVNEFGRPVFADNPPAERTVPMSDVLATRSGLTDDVRANRAAGQNQAARIGSKYVDNIDDYLNDAMDPAAKAQFDEARAARRDLADRFERPGTANAEVLRTREGGGYALDDSAVGPRYAQPDSGKLSDLKSLLAEAGTDARVREGLADTVAADIETRGLLKKPDALRKYLGDRNVLMGEFPELRARLEAAGMAADDLKTASRAAADTEKRLTTPGRSPEAAFLNAPIEDPAAALRSAVNYRGPDVEGARDSVRRLVESAGTPTAIQDLRATFWEEVKKTGKFSAKNSTGGDRWNGRKMLDLINDPKYSAVADELWADDPEDLADIKKVFSALAGSEGSTRAKAPGTSGTGQTMSGKFDASMTASGLASRGRSVSRGQLSPTIAVVDVVSTWLRRKSAQVQSRAIDQIIAEAINNPGMAADLLERYNPATAGAYHRMMTQKYGVRASTLLNLLDEAANDDPVLDAVQEDAQ